MSSPTSGDRPGRILVTDDRAVNRELLRELLEGDGHEVIEAADGSEALELLASSPYDVVLLDVMMPRVDGLTACHAIKQDPSLAHIPVLLITALSAEEHRLEGIEAGADDFLSKPVDQREVLLRIRNALRATRLHGEVRDAYERLKRLEEMRTSLSNMIVHDMRTPLMGLGGYIDIARKQVTSERTARHLDLAMSQARRLSDMVDNLLDIRRLEEGTLPIHIEPCGIRDLVDDAVRSIGSPELRTIETRADGGLMWPCDRHLMLRVFYNLIGNAIKFTPEDSEVSIEAVTDGGILRTQVRDHGPGIPADLVPTIFDPFVRGESDTRTRSGIGLGLAFCRLAVEAHGGRISVSSHIGDGACFEITLPHSLEAA